MKTISFKLLVLSIVLFPSCRTLYKPNAVNVPMLQEKREAKIYVGNNNLQVAYAVTNHVGLMLNGYYEAGKVNHDNGDYIKTKGYLGEIGAGYFMPFQNKALFEVYAGGGMGQVSISERATGSDGIAMNKYFDGNAYKMFIQPTYGYVGKFFEVGLTPRFTFVKYSNLNIRNYTQSEQQDYTYYQLNQPTWVFFEPALTLRGGYKWVKLQFQVGRSIKLNSDKLNYDGNLINGGVVIDIAKWYNND